MSTKDAKLITEAIAQKNAGNHVKSEKLYSEAIELNGENLHKAYYNKGNLLKEINKIGAALECYEKATSIKPDYGIAWFNWGNLLCKIHKYHEAIRVFEAAISIMPNEINPLFGIAYAYNRIGSPHKSQEILIELLEKVESEQINIDLLSKIHSELGLSFLQTNDVTKAKVHFIKAYELNEYDYQACYNIAYIADTEKRYDAALDFYDKAISIDPNEAKGYQGKGCTLIHSGNLEEALAYIEKAIELNPNDFEGYYNLACIYSGLNNEKAMLDAVSKTISLAPKQLNIGHHILNDPDFSKYSDKISCLL